MIDIHNFGMSINCSWMTPFRKSFRPPSWPPPRDWIVSEDRGGRVLSRWEDPIWDFSPWAGQPMAIDFGDGKVATRSNSIDHDNADLLRLLVTWKVWGPNGVATAGSLRSNFFQPLRKIFVLCSQNGVLATNIVRFPVILERLPEVMKGCKYKHALLELHRLWDARESIGFFILDSKCLKRLYEAAPPDGDPVQTAYIPPRIWTYQISRLRECLDDFNIHRVKIEQCFDFCLQAYSFNMGSLSNSMVARCPQVRLPFQDYPAKNPGVRSGCVYHGKFIHTAERFGLEALLRKWTVIRGDCIYLVHLSGYLSLVQQAAVAYIANFTLQRIKEVASLRSDCLYWENDPKLGRIPIVCGETTKTDLDSDARWPTSPSVEEAVRAMSCISRLRIKCADAHPDIRPNESELTNPYLYDRAFEPWVGEEVRSYCSRPYPQSYAKFIKNNPLLFDPEQIKITEEDLKVALTITPNIKEHSAFSVGKAWPFAFHQLRRTGAVNMFASGVLSNSTMQFQLKHSTRIMPLYYGRGFARLLLNEEVEAAIVAAMYQSMAYSLLEVEGDRFISPVSDKRKQMIVVEILSAKDAKSLVVAAREGRVFFRETRLGGCTKRGPCNYGGIESVAHCAGGDGDAPCPDALFDRLKAPQIEADLEQVDKKISLLRNESPRYKALQAERKGLEGYLDAIRFIK